MSPRARTRKRPQGRDPAVRPEPAAPSNPSGRAHRGVRPRLREEKTRRDPRRRGRGGSRGLRSGGACGRRQGFLTRGSVGVPPGSVAVRGQTPEAAPATGRRGSGATAGVCVWGRRVSVTRSADPRSPQRTRGASRPPRHQVSGAETTSHPEGGRARRVRSPWTGHSPSREPRPPDTRGRPGSGRVSGAADAAGLGVQVPAEPGGSGSGPGTAAGGGGTGAAQRDRPRGGDTPAPPGKPGLVSRRRSPPPQPRGGNPRPPGPAFPRRRALPAALPDSPSGRRGQREPEGDRTVRGAAGATSAAHGHSRDAGAPEPRQGDPQPRATPHDPPAAHKPAEAAPSTLRARPPGPASPALGRPAPAASARLRGRTPDCGGRPRPPEAWASAQRVLRPCNTCQRREKAA
ncbi:collagen alpha-1(I) chain-like [Meles meles]|uniref:collagen alpha-1(I) chain-like n=1 Tax=Meles meles TaxID=9662 RepID=UPI001E69EE16|nr:collagen alpha-1(I) chain-like [Meles meles]